MRKLCLILALVSFCTIAVAAKKYPFTANSIVPAAKGNVEVDKDNNGNVRIRIDVEHLADPQNLSPASNVYVVWIQDKGQAAENHGVMKVDKNLNANFETTTASKNFDLFVTGERDLSIKIPGGPEVFRTAIQP